MPVKAKKTVYKILIQIKKIYFTKWENQTAICRRILPLFNSSKRGCLKIEMSRIIAKLQRKSEFPNWIIKDFPSSFLLIIACKRNGQYYTDNSSNIGNQASRRDFCALHRKNKPCSIHQYMQSGRNPDIEIPFGIYPAEIERTDKGYTESRKCRKNIVSLIKMHGTKIKCR